MDELDSSDMAKTKTSGNTLIGKFLHPKQSFSNTQLTVFAVIFAAIGGFLLIRSFAFYDPTALVLYHPDGTLIQSTGDPKIYLIDGQKRHFVSLDAFRSGQYSLSDVKPATTGDEQYDIGDPITVPSGVLTQDRFTGDYYVTDTNSSDQVVRRPVSTTIAAKLGYDPNKAQVVTNLPAVQGQAESATSAHPDGSVVSAGLSITRNGVSRQTYLIQNGQLHLASADVLKTYKLNAEPILPANLADLSLPKGAPLAYASGTLVEGSDPNKVYVIQNDNGSVSKRLIRSWEVFTSLGYDRNNIIKIADDSLPAADGLPLPENDGTPIEVGINIKPGQDGKTLAKDYSGRSGTTVVYSYKDWVVLKLPFDSIASLKQDSRVAGVQGPVLATPSRIGCEDQNGNTVPCPSITSFDTNPGTITAGQSTTIEWRSYYTDYCSASGGWGGQKATSGSESTGALSSSTSYTLVCTSTINGDTPPSYTSVTVNAAPPPPPPPPSGGGSVSNTGLPSISGNLVVGSTLSTSNGSWSGSPTSFSYLWQRCDPNAETQKICTNIGSATSSSYVIQNGDAGFYLQVKVTASNGGGSASATSSPTGTVPAPSSSTPPPPPPPPPSGSLITNLTLPMISGSATVGSTLTTSNGTWSTNPVSYFYNWQHCAPGADSQPDKACSFISTGSSQSYTVQASDAGDYLRARVTAHGDNTATNIASAFSNATNVVPVPATPPPPPPPTGGTGAVTNTGLPFISGTTKVGSTLSASSGSWTGGPTKFSYLWQRCDPNVDSQKICTNIGTATSQSYTIQTGDANYQMQVRVTASNSTNTGVATSLPTAVIQENTPPPSAGGCDGGDGVYLYSGTNFSGNCSKFTASSAAPATWAIGNDSASSIKIIGGWTATLYRDSNYSGIYSVFSLSHPTLAIFDIGNGTTSSISISAGAAPVPTGLDCGDTSAEGVYLYSGTSYSGTCDHFTGTSTMAESWKVGENNTHSIKVRGNWSVVLYAGDNLRDPAYNVVVPSSATPSTLTSIPDLKGTAVGYSTSSLYAGRVGGGFPKISTYPQVSFTASPLNPTKHDVPEAGDTLTTTNGTWVPAATSYKYQWEVCTGDDTSPAQACLNISGATGQSYKVSSTYVNKRIRATVYATNASGSSFASSASVGPIGPAQGAPPPPTQLIVISLSAKPTTVAFGTLTTLSWTVSGATTCSPSGGTKSWPSQPIPLPAATWTSDPITQSVTFTLNCSNSSTGQTGSGSATVTVCGVACGSTGGNNLASKSPGLARIGWSPGGGGRVGIIGAGVRSDIPGLIVEPGQSFGDTNDCNVGGTGVSGDAHDTTVAEVIGLQGDGINSPAGVDPGATIVPLHVANNFDAGCAMRWAAANGLAWVETSEVYKASAFAPGTDFNNCNQSTTEAFLQAICDVSGSVRLVASAGNDAGDVSQNVPSRYSNVTAITSANEFDGLPPQGGAPITGDKFQNGSCGGASELDNYGASYADYSDGGKPLLAAPLCIWMGNSPSGAYPGGTSFAAPMAVGVFMRGGGGGGGAVLSNNGHNYGSEIHL